VRVPGEPVSEMSSNAGELASLMQRYQQSDNGAAQQLIDRLSPQIFRFFLAQVRDRNRAEDLLQDFWLRIHHARHTYRPGEPVLPWLYAIARRTQIDDYRRRSRISKHELQSEQLPDRTTAEAAGDRSYELAELLEPLPETQREVVVMLKVNGLSLDEVARATGSSVGAVKQKAHRAYETLRRRFGGAS
jgi:RNA polymerase sigma-70 factor, ECF subfamily